MFLLFHQYLSKTLPPHTLHVAPHTSQRIANLTQRDVVFHAFGGKTTVSPTPTNLSSLDLLFRSNHFQDDRSFL